MFVVREAREADLDGIEQLARHLDTVNLPAERAALETLIQRSTQSFAGTLEDPHDGFFLFALEELATGNIVGVSMVIAAHGTMDDPHHSFQIHLDERYSATLGKLFRHQTLTFKQSFTPHTEIGALILSPNYRGHSAKLGKLISFARFLYIARYPDRFLDVVQAELLPPFEPDGTSLLWNWLGRTFTGMTYLEADRLSTANREFMKSLFPSTPIYTSLMPEEVRNLVGSVGPSTRGVARMLRSIGFHFNNHIDPFDGGPHYEAETRRISLIERHIAGNYSAVDSGATHHFGIVGTFDTQRGTRIAQGHFSMHGHEIWVSPGVAQVLQLSDREKILVAPYPLGPS